MKSIANTVYNEVVINKSKFITKLLPISDLSDIENILNDVKAEYKGATHYCYAYKYNNYKKYTDDKEPSNTAGLPILSILDYYNLNNIMCIVIRYYGGIKLGTGGLVRAYQTATKEAIEKASIIELSKGNKITIEFNYDNLKAIDFILKKYEIILKEYKDTIKYSFLIEDTECDIIIDHLKNFIIKCEKKDNIWIPK